MQHYDLSRIKKYPEHITDQFQ